jgi:hypothetical protein
MVQKAQSPSAKSAMLYGLAQLKQLNRAMQELMDYVEANAETIRNSPALKAELNSFFRRLQAMHTLLEQKGIVV